MICKKCGKQLNQDDTFCSYCGSAVNPSQKQMHTALVILLLFIIPPVGIYFMWAKIGWKKGIKIALTVFFTYYTLSALSYAINGPRNDQSSAPTSATTTATHSSSASTPPITTTTSVLTEEQYKSACATIEYKALARNPGKHKGELFTFTGEVIQVRESKGQAELRINITAKSIGDKVYYSDTIYALVYLEEGADRILDGDILTIWGECSGLFSYEAILGQQVSMPGILIQYYELNE